MESTQIVLGAVYAALIVICGALYALLFAYGRLRPSRRLTSFAYASFACLCLCAFGLVLALDLAGFWVVVTAVMLFGYLFAPRAIWHLCVGTHGSREGVSSRDL